MWEIGERLRETREAAEITIGQVVEYEGISKSYISQLESGRNTPNWDLLARLARRYKVSADYILGLIDKPLPIERKQLPVPRLAIHEESALYAADSVQEVIWLMRDMPEEKQKAIVEIVKVVKGLNS